MEHLFGMCCEPGTVAGCEVGTIIVRTFAHEDPEAQTVRKQQGQYTGGLTAESSFQHQHAASLPTEEQVALLSTYYAPSMLQDSRVKIHDQLLLPKEE